jgi:hypothetical protein
MPILYILTGAIVFYCGYIAGKPRQDKPMISFPFVPKVDDKPPKDDKEDDNINKFYA